MFDFIVVTPAGLADPSLAIAASRAGALGVVDLQFLDDIERAIAAVRLLAHQSRGRWGIKLDSRASPLYDHVLSELPPGISAVILSPTAPERMPECVHALRERHVPVLLEVISKKEAYAGEEAGVDGLIAKGEESGGRIGDETTFVLLQRLLATTSLRVWAHGGIGLHSATACFASGAAGVVLDSQLALTRESTLSARVKAAIARVDGSETVCVGHELGAAVRTLPPPGSTALSELQRFADRLQSGADDNARDEWWRRVGAAISSRDPSQQVWAIGQEGTVAAQLARRFDRVADVLAAFRQAAVDGATIARTIKPLQEGAALARAHGTRYPIVQGPMTRVSDKAAFAAKISEGGALPILALALMRGGEVAQLLEETHAALGARPWGAGILGFVPEELRAEQLHAVRNARPSFALIAGGRPDQAMSLEQDGIPTYLHVPSPGLLKLFVETGARRFVFEGRECGGHVGPRSSFALWDAAVDTLLSDLPTSEIAQCHVLFAGGIHDARSSSMVAALAAPLVQRGAKIGVLLGTAYLFTREAVASGAIVEGFQRQALACHETVLLTSGAGHSTRCAVTPFAAEFDRERSRLIEEGRPADEIRATLEAFNVGRLRVAAKGMTRSVRRNGDASGLVAVSADEQYVDGMYMIGQLAALRDSTCSIAELHHDVSHGGSERLDHVIPVRLANAATRDTSRPFDVAIVGMSCLLPKAPNVRTYWDNILNKVNAVTEVPPDRWDWRKYFDPEPGVADRVRSKWGGFLDSIRFDPARYGMPPNSLASIEPLQLLTLEVVRAALADAGYEGRRLPNERTAVVLGVGGGIADLGQQYAVRSALPTLTDSVPEAWLSKLATWTEDSFPGILPNVAAGRVANRFNLSGVNFTVDAACASSLAAVYLACRELEARTSDVVVVGGADTIQNPFAYLCFGKAHALSPRGRCATFDESADGIAISEGIAVLILKRLDDAERDGDRIYAVIKGVAGSSDGRDKGLTAPSPEGQALALERAHEKAGVSAATVGLVEAHGTGTVVGDQAELATLNRVFRAAGATSASCAIGSVKSMIGHTKSTAGVAGLMKVALALRHKILPPTMHVSTPNETARQSGSPLYVNTETRPWVHADTTVPRRAGVSAFGFGGTNFHAVLEEYTGDYLESERETPSRSWPSELLIWSGTSREEIHDSIAQLSGALARGARYRLCDIAFSAWQSTQNRQGATLAMVVKSIDELAERLNVCAQALTGSEAGSALASKNIFFTETPLAPGNRTAFLFPGQGSQYPGMLSELATYFTEVRTPFERASRGLARRFPRPLATFVFPPPRFSAEDRHADVDALSATAVAQPALGAAGLALVRLLSECGVRPDMVAGHSYGEYVALCAAGSFDEDALYTLSEARGRLITENCTREATSMAAVAADRARTESTIATIDGVWVANINAPLQTVISGTREAVQAAIERLAQAGIASRRLTVACAFHSPLMKPGRAPLSEIIERVALRAPRVPVFSNVSAAPYPPNASAMSELLAEQLVSPVRFAEQIEAMYAAGARIFVEPGPSNVLSGLVDQTLGARSHVSVPLDLRERSGLFQFQHAVGLLAAHGVPVNLDAFFARRDVRQIDVDAPFTDDEAPASSTTWIVTGGSAAPMRSNSAAAIKTANGFDTVAATLGTDSPAPPATAVPAMRRPEQEMPSISQRPDDETGVMLQFQQLMAGFLDTQKQVMLAYLAGGRAGSTVGAAVPNETSEAAATFLTLPRTASAPPIASLPRRDAESAAAQLPGQQGTTDDLELTTVLLSIVSDRTGYPTELLGLDLNLESDLGIDSIKRVEIVGEFGRRVVRSHGIALQDVIAEVTSAKTLRTIVESTQNVISGVRVPSVATSLNSTVEPARRTDESRDLPRFVFAIEDAPLPATAHRVGADDLIVVTDDGLGVAGRVAHMLRAAGAHVAILGQTAGDSDGANERVDLTDERLVSERLDAARSRHARPISGILHLLPLRGRSNLVRVAAQQAAGDETHSLLHIIRAAASDLRQAGAGGRGWVIAATAMGGAFGAQRNGDDWPFVHGAIGGFMKTLADEWPQVRCKLVDLELETPSVLSERLLAEIESASDFVEVGWEGSRRATVVPVHAPLQECDGAGLALDSNSVLLVTGGARGITAAISHDIARRYRPTLVILGRTPVGSDAEALEIAGAQAERDLKTALLAIARRSGEPTTAAAIEKAYVGLIRQREVRANLEKMRQSGARVDYRQVDVLDDRALGAAVDDVYAFYGRIDGVIHGAGVVEDALLEQKTPESFARVFDTKVRSALTLARHVRHESLQFFALFSSVAGCFGNRGQVDYAAANETLNKLALHMDRRCRGRVVSLNWGPWASNGMASERIRQQFIDRGITPIELAAGCRAFDRELRCGRKGQVEVVWGHGRWDRSPEDGLRAQIERSAV